jgi:hypothetical protein
MKNFLFVLVALAGGILGAYLFQQIPALSLGATTARTTITNPWTFSATTTFSGKSVLVTSANTATSTVAAGCYEFYATSTATALKFQASTTPGIMYSQYGTCPRL